MSTAVHPVNSSTDLASSDLYDDDYKSLPEPYNLVKGSGKHSNAMARPTKECTLGKIMNFIHL